jgi:hypothetical protein
VVGIQLCNSPLTHLQMIVDREHEVLEQVLPLLPLLSKVHKTLRGLSLLDLPEEFVLKSLKIISTACPMLRHIGLMPLPATNVSRHMVSSLPKLILCFSATYSTSLLCISTTSALSSSTFRAGLPIP